jgi:hypothetical protein
MRGHRFFFFCFSFIFNLFVVFFLRFAPLKVIKFNWTIKLYQIEYKFNVEEEEEEKREQTFFVKKFLLFYYSPIYLLNSDDK